MPDRKISQLPITETFDAEDIIPIVDVSETRTKKLKIGNLLTDQMTADEKTKLAGIADGATANQTDAHLLNRNNHVGTIPASVVSDFNTVVDARISSSDEAGHGSGSVTQHSDVTNAGSGQIITTAERNSISNLGTASTKDVATTGDASDTQVVKGNDSRLTDARHPILP